MRLVLLHGYDSSPDAFADVAAAVAEGLPAVRVIAVPGPVVLPSGTLAWWDDNTADSGGAPAALAWLTTELEREPDEPTVIAGFSQGGALALAAGFAGLANVVGFACVGGFVPDDTLVTATELPLFIGHGENDEVVDPFHAESLARRASKAGINHHLETHDGGHVWPPSMSEAFVSWLESLALDSASD